MMVTRNLALALVAVVLTASTPATASTFVENHMSVSFTAGNEGIAVYEYGSGIDASGNFAAGTHDATQNNAGTLEMDLSAIDWWDVNWIRRQCFTVTSSATVAEYPLRLVVDTSASASAKDDLRVVVGVDGAELPLYVEGTVPSSSTVVYAQAEPLPAGDSTYCVYFDNDDVTVTSNSDESAPWSYTTQTVRYYTMLDTYVGNGVDSRSTVVSYSDGNTVTDGITVLALNTGGSGNINQLDQQSVITATGPISASMSRNGKEVLVPESFADNRFSFPTTGGTDRLFVRSPFAATTLEFRVGGSLVQTLPITPANGSMTVSLTTSGNQYVSVTSTDDTDFLAAHAAPSGTDVYVGVPWYGDALYGVAGDAMRVGSTGTATVTWQRHDGTSGTQGLNGTDAWSSSGYGTGGAGAAFRLSGDAYFAAVQQGDGNGTDATNFWPERLLSRRYYIPTNTDYTVAACPVPGTLISVNGGAATSCSGTGVGWWRTTASLNTGDLIEADHPIFIYTDVHSAPSDEHNVLNPKVHTPYVSSLSVSAGIVDDLELVCGNWTSTALAADGVFGAISIVASTPSGTTVTLQLSTDGGTTFFGPDGTDVTTFADRDLVPYGMDFVTSSVVLRLELCTTDVATLPTVMSASFEHSLGLLAPTLTGADPIAISSSPSTSTTPVLRVYSPSALSWTSWLDLTGGSNLGAGNYLVHTDHPTTQITDDFGAIAEPSTPIAHDFATPYSVLVNHATTAGQNVTMRFDVVDDGQLRLTTPVQLDFAA